MKSFKTWLANVLTLNLAFQALYNRNETVVPSSVVEEVSTQGVPVVTEYTLAEVIELYGDEWGDMATEAKIELLNKISPVGEGEVAHSEENVDDTFLQLAEFCEVGGPDYDEEFATAVALIETTEGEPIVTTKTVDTSTLEFSAWERNEEEISDGAAILRDTVVAWLFNEHDLHAEVGGTMLPIGQATIGDNEFAQFLRNQINSVLKTSMEEIDFEYTKPILAEIILQWGPVFDMEMVEKIVSLLDILCPNFMLETRMRQSMVQEIFYENAEEEEEVEEPLEIPALA